MNKFIEKVINIYNLKQLFLIILQLLQLYPILYFLIKPLQTTNKKQINLLIEIKLISILLLVRF